jgi:hypothetical protein
MTPKHKVTIAGLAGIALLAILANANLIVSGIIALLN